MSGSEVEEVAVAAQVKTHTKNLRLLPLTCLPCASFLAKRHLSPPAHFSGCDSTTTSSTYLCKHTNPQHITLFHPIRHPDHINASTEVMKFSLAPLFLLGLAAGAMAKDQTQQVIISYPK
jgi:hypothetical protein